MFNNSNKRKVLGVILIGIGVGLVGIGVSAGVGLLASGYVGQED